MSLLCTGTGGWRVSLDTECPWCLEKRRCLYAEVFGGWCGRDYICGTCGTRWSTDDPRPIRKHTENERDKNIARVAAQSDPKCWECHDTGDTGGEMDEPDTHPCQCRAHQ